MDRFEVERPHLKPLARWPYRPVSPRHPEPSAGRDEAVGRPRLVEVEHRPLASRGELLIFDPSKQVRLDVENLPDHLADLTSGRGGLGIVVCVGEVIAQITDLTEASF